MKLAKLKALTKVAVRNMFSELWMNPRLLYPPVSISVPESSVISSVTARMIPSSLNRYMKLTSFRRISPSSLI